MDGDRGRSVTLERQLTTRKVWPVCIGGGEDEGLVGTDETLTTRKGIRTTRRMMQTTLTGEVTVSVATCHCGKICKNSKGLKIHQAKTKCGQGVLQTQRAGVEPGETQEDSRQEAPHSTGDPQAPESPQAHRRHSPQRRTVTESQQPRSREQVSRAERQAHPVKDRIKWPKMSDTKAWEHLDADLNQVLEASLAGAVERKVESLTAITYNLARERFGVEEKKKKSQQTTKQPNRREREIRQLRREIKALNKKYKRGPASEKEGIKQLTCQLRERLCRLRRAENVRKQRKQRANKRAQFVKDPFRFTKSLLGEAKSGRLASGREEVEEFLREAHNDELRHEALEENSRIKPVPVPTKPLDTSEPTWKEVQDVVRKARAGSAPGPSGIPYKVYKKCPLLLRRLWRLLRRIWGKGVIPTSWKRAEGCFIPKEVDSSAINQFRTISLLCVECKIYFSVLARRLVTYITENQYIDTSVQKGGIPGFSGCLEHTGVLTQVIREAKANKSDLTVVWLDLANAYGSIPHGLIQVALDHYHVPASVKGMVTSYFGGIQLRFRTADFTTQWQNLEKGIVTGCTISPILFIMGMNLLIDAAATKAKGPRMNSGSRQPPIRGFMDDITLTTVTHVEARWMLAELDYMATWARMRFKPKKSRCMIIKKGKVTSRFKLEVQGEPIPSIVGNPIKCLGRWFDDSLTDRHNVDSTVQQTEEWLRRIEKSGLPGKFKAWLYQHGLLPRLMWLLTVYELPLSRVAEIERKVNKHLRKWLGIPPSFTAVGLYTKSGQLQLPLSSVVEEYKVAKCRTVLLYSDSQDQKVREAGVTTRAGRKFKANELVAQAKSMLLIRDIIGATNSGRQGLGSSHFQQWGKASKKERRAMVQTEVRQLEEEGRRAKAVELSSQGAWTRWNLPSRKLTWADVWKLEPFRISFLLRSVYDTLPSPANLCRWNLREDPACKLCGERGTMAHILSGCKVALAQGRYRWRHDKVLAVIAELLEQQRRKKRQDRPRSDLAMTFVREGEVKPAAGRRDNSILQRAKSWELRVDLGRRMHFPQVVQTNLRPDAVLSSEDGKKIVMIELTVPWEEGCEEANERKRAKYQDLLQQCRDKGWQAWLFPVEVGCRGFPAQSVWKMLSAVGITGRDKKVAVRKMGEAAERASCWLWCRRETTSWKPGGADEQ
ncbi:hypothetical protein Bbelb_209270 [Branchiostoma belcheri]|nr:hypothetical protein Bbelb_209270 [Branchiostoma belcheri]